MRPVREPVLDDLFTFRGIPLDLSFSLSHTLPLFNLMSIMFIFNVGVSSASVRGFLSLLFCFALYFISRWDV
jgi:hypothetical protein